MNSISVRQFLLLVGVMIIDIFLVWFGFKLLLANNDASRGQLFLVGCAAVLSGVFALSSQLPKREIWSIALILVGVYYFARADGIISNPILSRLLGLVSIGAAVLLTYIALPRNNQTDGN
jgi:hypothetical protein